MDLVRELEPLLLAAVRVTVFLVLAPPFSHGAVPGAVKAILGVGLAFALAPPLAAANLSTAGFIGQLVSEAVIGGGLGVLVAVVFTAVQAAGRLIDHLGGFEMGMAFDPMSMTHGGQFTQLYALAATVLLFVSDGYQLVIGGLARSFRALPLGATLDLPALAESLTGAVGQMMVAALQVAGPLIAVLFLADVGLGLLTRVAPALNAFALGFPLKILITLVLGTFALVALPRVIAGLSQDALGGIAGVAG
ncbi:flagellar biosynthetic protein FliR [Georgenia thermotolerans]|uniref:Flagellar biosynthetic protein FliR n=1 Tax=Georgenia thermotolerans TaxID=527326 RepID=A0A7J5ULZ1_9MICO|nr:flagellar biosynthetic protein FliR [Georgenia thermotolerans]KAE8763395.1 flagellar biosynthetic protein FliR [Georgenia thermotolerans]